eukprot:TRINITY_DN7456_c0_g1_i1.p1 TRINITY_DN7456_c0_g1~~TRINITY_DN7456_c0_g1_i1.p1  ORF type:complete len:328 (+),score=47.16 TRINITY_DN7456_c0_g1_i1:107-1090(+)
MPIGDLIAGYCPSCGATCLRNVCDSCGGHALVTADAPPHTLAAVEAELAAYALDDAQTGKNKKSKNTKGKDAESGPDDAMTAATVAASSAMTGGDSKKKQKKFNGVFDALPKVKKGIELADDDVIPLKASDELAIWRKRCLDDPPSWGAKFLPIVATWVALPGAIRSVIMVTVILTLNCLVRYSPLSFFIFFVTVQVVALFLGSFVASRVKRAAEKWWTGFRKEHAFVVDKVLMILEPQVRVRLEIMQHKFWFKRVKLTAIVSGVLAAAVSTLVLPTVVFQWLGLVLGTVILALVVVLIGEAGTVAAPYQPYARCMAAVTEKDFAAR